MQVTKIGTKPDERKWFGECRVCKSEATANGSEMNHITLDQREGGSFSWEKCPVCGAGGKDSGYGGMIFYPEQEKCQK